MPVPSKVIVAYGRLRSRRFVRRLRETNPVFSLLVSVFHSWARFAENQMRRVIGSWSVVETTPGYSKRRGLKCYWEALCCMPSSSQPDFDTRILRHVLCEGAVTGGSISPRYCSLQRVAFRSASRPSSPWQVLLPPHTTLAPRHDGYTGCGKSRTNHRVDF